MTLKELLTSWYSKSQDKVRELSKLPLPRGAGERIPGVKKARQEGSGGNGRQNPVENNNPDASKAESLDRITFGFNKGVPHEILTPERANQPCNSFTEEALLSALNDSAGLSLTMEDTNVRKGIEILGKYEHDFGTAYAWFKTASVLEKVSLGRNFQVNEKLRTLPNLENYDESLTTRIHWGPGDYISKCRINDTHERILNPECAEPRRLWDLYSNRVIPYDWHIRRAGNTDEHASPRHQLRGGYVAQSKDPADDGDNAASMARVVKPFVAISHSWTADMRPVLTTINRQQWPVPLPVEENGPEATLEHIRLELLNTKIPNPHDDRYQDGLPMIYVWLDILCLRQSSHGKNILDSNPDLALKWSKLDEVRLTEWEIDVPTMGMVYTIAEYVVCYMNGIGRPFREDGWDDERHWVNRAWTMQEYVPKGDPKKDKVWGSKQVFLEPLIMGMPEGNTSFTKYKPFEIGYFARPPPPWEHPHPQDQLPNIVHQLARRHSANPCDKIAVFAAAIRRDLPEPPVYSPGEDPELAWSRLLNAMGHQTRRNTFFHLDSQTGGWAPTWSELMHPYSRILEPHSSDGQALPTAQTSESIATTLRRRPYIASFSIKCTVKSEPSNSSGSTDSRYIQGITADLHTNPVLLGQGSHRPENPLHLRLHTKREVSPGEYFLIVADKYHLFDVLPNNGTGIPAALCLPITLAEPNCSPSYRKIGIGLLEWCLDIDELKVCKGRLYSILAVKADMLDTLSKSQLAKDFPDPSTRPYSIVL